MNNTASPVLYVDNTGADTREFHAYFAAFVLEGTPLPEEIADIFSIKIVEVNGAARGILNFA